MPEGVEVEVETVDLDNQVADAPMRNKRFLGFNVRIVCPTKMTIIFSQQVLKELCHDILSHSCEVQNHLQIDERLKIIFY